MWGVLLTGCQLPFMGFPRMLPVLAGYAIIIWGVSGLIKEGAVWYEEAKKRAVLVAALCVVTELLCIFLDGQVITECVMVLFYMEEILLYSDFMRAGRKQLAEHNEDKIADEFKKKRLLYLKVFLLVVVLKIVQAAAVGVMSYKPEFRDTCMTVYNVLNYAVITTALVVKIWFSTAFAKLAKFAEDHRI